LSSLGALAVDDRGGRARLAPLALARLDIERVVNALQRAAPVCQADFVVSKPGFGGDEGLMILSNEMARTLTLIRNRGRLDRVVDPPRSGVLICA
jgi:hypothetical protein